MNRPELHIALCADDKFMPHCAATVASVLQTNPDYHLHVHLVSRSLLPENIERMTAFLANHQGTFHYYPLSQEQAEMFSVFSDTKRLSKATYFRLFLPELLPSHLSRVLYLDCDLIVRKSLRPFWEMDLTDYGLAAKHDKIDEINKRSIRLGYEARHGYFNAGVLLINLDYWRVNKVLERCFTLFQTYPERIFQDDQDVLNSVLAGKVKWVSAEWNCIDVYFLRKARQYFGPITKEEEQALHDPAIVHFTGIYKPWSYRCFHPWRKLYFQARSLTPWADSSPDKQWGYQLRHRFRTLCIRLGLSRRRFIALD